MRRILALLCLLVSLLTLSACQLLPTVGGSDSTSEPVIASPSPTALKAPLLTQVPSIPAYAGATGSSFVTLNDNKPFFTEEDLSQAYGTEVYGALDTLGRCTGTFAVVGKDTMPSEGRGYIGMVRPTGWQRVEYSFVDGLSLYNRCHLIAWSLTNEEANERNLVTGTRTMNTAQVPFEQEVLFYVRETGNHVAYRSTPLFTDDNLVCDGILMEAYSLEDRGESVQFCAFFYNVEPGVDIDYRTGESELAAPGSLMYDEKRQKGTAVSGDDGGAGTGAGSGSGSASGADGGSGSDADADSGSDKLPVPDAAAFLAFVDSPDAAAYVLNVKTMKFHHITCENALASAERNRRYTTSSPEEIMDAGFAPSGCCNP